jgi:hypothetical protein
MELGQSETDGFIDSLLLGTVDVLGETLGEELGQCDTEGLMESCPLGMFDTEGLSVG